MDLFLLVLTFMKTDEVYKIFPNIKIRHEMSNKLLRKYLTLGSNKATESAMDNVYLFSIVFKSSLLLDLNKNIAYGIFYSEPFQYVFKSDLNIINESRYIMNFDDLEVRSEMSPDATELNVDFVIRPENFTQTGHYKHTEALVVLEDQYIKDTKFMKEIIQKYHDYKVIHRLSKDFWQD